MLHRKNTIPQSEKQRRSPARFPAGEARPHLRGECLRRKPCQLVAGADQLPLHEVLFDLLLSPSRSLLAPLQRSGLPRLWPLAPTSYQRNKTNSAQKPGPIAARMLNEPGSGRRLEKTSSRTSNTDVEEMFPTRRKQAHDADKSSAVIPSAVAVASKTLGPPVCMIQDLMSERFAPFSARNASTSLPRCLVTMSGTSGDSTMRKPFSEMSQPMTFSLCK